MSFSGGLDSSLVLAAGTRAAQREGLSPPIPVTLRFRDAPGSEESGWQERVMGHLGLADWERIEVGSELDFAGPVAAPALIRHGVLYPANAHVHAPMLAKAAAGTLLTGVGGDQLLLVRRWRRAAAVLARRARPGLRDVPTLTLALSPPPVRRWREGRRGGGAAEWLREPLRSRVARELAHERASEPLLWRRRLARTAGGRELAMTRHSLDLLARDAGAGVSHPLLDGGFIAAVAKAGGRFGFEGRRAALLALFTDALPLDVLRRGTKAHFDEALWGGASRSFAAQWDGDGVDPAMVDPVAVRSEWLKDRPDARAAPLLQAAWLARQDSRSEGSSTTLEAS